MPFINKSNLNYPANVSDAIRRYSENRAPLITDYKQFIVGDEWLDATASQWYKLAFKDSTQGIWRLMTAAAFTTESLVTADANVVGPNMLGQINVLGGAGVTTTGNPGTNTVTVSLSGGSHAIDSITSDVGGPVQPDGAGNMNIVSTATNGIHIVGNPATFTHTVSMATPYADGNFEFRNTVAATPRSLTVSNWDINAASNALVRIETPNLGADPYINFLVTGGKWYSVGIDNSDNDVFKITNWDTPSAGETFIKLGFNGVKDWLGMLDATEPLIIADASLKLTDTVAGGNVGLTIWNNDNTNAASFCAISTVTGGAVAGDPFFNVSITGAATYSIGIDNSDNDYLKIVNGVSPSAANTFITIGNDGIKDFIGIFDGGAPGLLANSTIRIQDSTIGGNVGVLIENTDNTNANSDAGLSIGTHIGGGKSFLGFGSNVASDYVMGVDASDGRKFKFNSAGARPGLGPEILSVNPAAANAIRFNNAYTFPVVDGAAGQVLKTNGAGAVTWGTTATSGELVQYVYVKTTAVVICAQTTTLGGVPNSGEGSEVITLTITPKVATNRLVIKFLGIGFQGTGDRVYSMLFQDANPSALAATFMGVGVTTNVYTVSLNYSMLAGTVLPTTFKIRCGALTAAGFALNSYNAAGATAFGAANPTCLEIWEIEV